MIVGIVGAGNMGTGIAKAFAMNDGFTVYLCDSNELIANKAKRRIGKELEYSVERGRYTKEQAKITAYNEIKERTIKSNGI